ncbi:tape measure domain [Brevibacterium casei]|uniref:Tape measure domain n=2 Tax=Brevibacterium casei TaxID=33889 RepID=A0A449D7I5_9MICO|nr:tape measure domain [Brevibacterium casei]
MADRTVSVRLQLLVDQYKANAEGAAAATRKVANEGDKAGNVIGRSMGAAAKTAGIMGTAAVAGVTALGVSAAKTGTAYNTLEQTSRAAFKTVLGSADAANKMMEELSAFAKTSPFPRQAFIQGTQQLLAFGFEAKKVIPTLGAVQDAVAAAGGGAQQISEVVSVLAKIQSSSKITAEDLNMLAERGINAADLIGKGMGKSAGDIRTSITKGSLEAGQALDTLVAQMDKQYGGAAENVKNTWAGATDRIKGAWRDISSIIAEPFVAKGGGGLALDWANAMADAMRAVEGKAKPTVDIIMNRLNPSLEKVEPLIRKIESGINGIDLRQLDTQLDKLGKYTPAIGGVAAGLAAMATQVGPLQSLGVAINPAVAGLAALVALSPDLRSALGEFMAGLEPLVPVAKELGLTMLEVATSVLETLSPALGELLRTAGEAASILGTGLGQAATTVVQALVPAAEIVSTLLEVIAGIPAPVIAAAAAFGALQMARGPIMNLTESMIGLGQQMALHRSLAAMSGQSVGVMGSAMSVAQGKVVGLGTAMKTAFLSNPIGLAITGITMVIGGLVAAQASAAQKTQEHKQQVQTLTDALIESRGAIDDNVEAQLREQVAQAEGSRSKEGVLSLLRELGIEQGEYTDALLGGSDAQAQFVAQLDEAIASETEWVGQGNNIREQLTERGKKLQDVKDAFEGNTAAVNEGKQAAEDWARENGVSTESLKEQNRALDENIRLQKEKAGNNLSQAQAELRYQETLDASTEKIKANGAETDLTSKKGQENQQALLDQASAHQSLIDSMQRNNVSSDELKEKMGQLREDFIKNAEAAGYSADEAAELADKYGLIPDSVLTKAELEKKDAEERLADLKGKLKDLEKQEPTPKVKADIKDVKSKIKQAEGDLAEIDGKTATIRVKLVTEGNIRNMPETLLNPNRKAPSAPGVEKKASGGAISGPGTGTSDSIIARLSNGEHVLTAEEVRKLGGQSEVYRLRDAIMSGSLPEFAKGGAVAAAERRVDQASSELRMAQRAKSDAKSKSSKSNATARVRAAQDELAAAKRSLGSAKKKAVSDEKAAKLAAERAKEEADRRQRVGDMRTDLRTDLRRGSIRDQVTGGLSGGYSAVDRLYGLGSNEDLSRGSRSRANSSARKFEANLRSLYGQAERIDAKLKAAQDKAQELKGIKSSVVNSLLNGRDLDVGTFSTNVGGKWVTGSNLGQAAKSLRVDVGAMKAFAGKLKKLVQLGVPGAIVQEIAQAGVVEGSNMADSFIDATAADRKSYLGAWAEYEKYANQAGQYVTEGFYKGGANAADGVVKGLEGRKKSVESAIANLAKAMESTFKSVLGIRSPSTVMAELGGFTAEGLVQGMLGGVTDVQAAAAALGAAAVPSDMSFAVSATPVVADDEGQAGLAMQDMSTTTLDAMSQMQTAVSEGFAGMLANTQAAQAGMLADTQTNQTGMLTATQTSNANMLVNTQTQQEAMRLAVATKQLEARTAATTEQEAMRLMLLDKQSQMKNQSATDFESMRLTTSTKLGDMRRGADTTMLGMHGDQSTRLDSMKATNKAGFESMLSTSNANMRAIRSGMDAEMSGAKPELGSNLNKLISVFASFTASVNKAFGEVGVKLNAPTPLKFETGGVMPGYTPGRDVHEFYSPTAGNLYLSGGEAIMRPEWTRAMGGEAGVKAQNDAARAGRLDDLLHMQTGGEAFASGGVYGPVPGVNAFADAGVWRGLWGIIKSKFPSATLNSAYRGGATTVSGNKSYHSRGMAVDLGGPMRQIFDFLYNNYRNSSEIIYSPAGGRQIKNGQPYTYSGAVRKIHWNHVHWANRSVPGGAGSDMTPGAFTGGDDFMPPSHPFLDRAGVSAGSNLEKSYQQAAQKLTAQIYAKHAKLLPSGIAGQLGKGIMSQISEGLVKKAADYGKSQTFVMPGGSGVERWRDTVIQALKRVGLPTSDDYVNAWLRQIKSESGGNPSIRQQVRDVNSGGNEAMGLVQVIPGTFAAFRDKSLPNDRTHPLANLVAGMNWAKYKAGRRGTSMLSFIGKGHGYEDGTKNAKRGLAIVGESGPELVNFQGGEQVLSNPESMRFMAANRTYVPTQRGMQFDQAAFTRAVADAVTANGVSPESIAAAMNGVRFTLKAGQHEFDAAVVTAVGTGYDQSVSRRSKSSQKIGAI